MLYYIETQCTTASDQMLFVGNEHDLRAFMDALSAHGWDIVKTYPLPAPPQM